jgi:DNA-binding CsgD family transcriptional regulator
VAGGPPRRDGSADGHGTSPAGRLDFDATAATALSRALFLAREHGGAPEALRALGVDLEDADRLEGLSGEFSRLVAEQTAGESVAEALALGFLAGCVAHRPDAPRRPDVTSFLMDRDLFVQSAEGESILRLPWFDDGLFIGRQLPDIVEMPTPVRRLCVENYGAALNGDRRRFHFNSYGHAYAVDAAPVRGDDGRIEAVLAIATLTASVSPAAMAYERTAELLEGSAARAEHDAEAYRRVGRPDAEAAERELAGRAREAAEQARANARILHSRQDGDPPDGARSLTPRETDVLLLASHSLTHSEIARHLVLSTATVKTHFEHIYAKLGVSDKAGAVAAALRHGLIP